MKDTPAPQEAPPLEPELPALTMAFANISHSLMLGGHSPDVVLRAMVSAFISVSVNCGCEETHVKAVLDTGLEVFKKGAAQRAAMIAASLPVAGHA